MKRKLKKTLALVLTILMASGLMPMEVMAAATETTGEVLDEIIEAYDGSGDTESVSDFSNVQKEDSSVADNVTEEKSNDLIVGGNEDEKHEGITQEENRDEIFEIKAAVSDYTQWKQYDSEWNQAEAWPASQYPNATERWMKGAGCVVTSIAMLLRHYNVITTSDVNQFNPWICNETLKNAGAFNSAADLYWSLGNAYPGFTYQDSVNYSLDMLISLYNQGYACLVKVNGSGGYDHYVAVRNISGSDVIIMDPGSTKTRLSEYSSQYTIIYYKASGSPNNGNEDPTISNVQIVDRTSLGYTITCEVSDGVTSVQFPTWPSADDSGNPIWHEGKIINNVACCRINTSEHGEKRDCYYYTHIYAYNSNGNSTSCAAPAAYVGASDEAPFIKDIKAVDCSSDGYTLVATLTSNIFIDSVKVPTWPSADDSGQPIWHEGSINGTTATCRINISDHGNKNNCDYVSHFYIYDSFGNTYVCAYVEYVDAEAPKIKNVRISDVSKDGYTVSCEISDNGEIDRVQFPTWTTYNSQDDLDKEWQTSSFSKGIINGNTVTYRVNTADHNNENGEYHTHIYVYDTYGNVGTTRIISVIDGNVESLATEVMEYGGNKYYLFEKNGWIWNQAKTYCESLGGHLVTITSAAEQEAVQKLAERGSQNAYYIGATDEELQNEWKWVTGETFSYTNWAPGEPSKTKDSDNYLVIYRPVAYMWNDTEMGGEESQNGFICEFESMIKENPFTDVAENMYYYDPVLWALNNGITSGLDSTHFAPEEVCTRGQVVTFLWRAMGEPEPVGNQKGFSDVLSSAYYYKAVMWAAENGITSGLDSTHFAPDETVTRGQFVTFLHRAEGKLGYSIDNPFEDLLENMYYYDAVLWAYENGITSGLDATHFAPDEVCTRGQVVTFLYRAYH